MELFTIEAIRTATADFDNAAILGTGSFACVFRAELPVGGVPTLVAVKRLNDGIELREIRKELALFARVRHERLLRILGMDDGLSCVVTPLMEGGDLERRLASEPSLRADERLQIAADCAEGLKALHALKFVHRDLKPANVLLTADMRAVRAPAQSAASSHPTPGTDAA